MLVYGRQDDPPTITDVLKAPTGPVTMNSILMVNRPWPSMAVRGRPWPSADGYINPLIPLETRGRKRKTEAGPLRTQAQMVFMSSRRSNMRPQQNLLNKSPLLRRQAEVDVELKSAPLCIRISHARIINRRGKCSSARFTQYLNCKRHTATPAGSASRVIWNRTTASISALPN
jgi:hypothetical protein